MLHTSDRSAQPSPLRLSTQSEESAGVASVTLMVIEPVTMAELTATGVLSPLSGMAVLGIAEVGIIVVGIIVVVGGAAVVKLSRSLTQFPEVQHPRKQ